MKFFPHPIDMAKVETVVYHLPDGKSYAVHVDSIEQFMEFGPGQVCDTSDIDGIVHFFPRGNA